MRKIVNIIKTFSIDNEDDGSVRFNKKDSIIGFIVILCLFIYATFMTLNSMKVLFSFILFSYLMIITFSFLLFTIFLWLYNKPKNNISKKKSFWNL